MSKRTLRNIWLWGLAAFLAAGSPPLGSSDRVVGLVRVVSVSVERVASDKVHLQLKVVNDSGSPVFGTTLDTKRRIPYPVFLEQWRSAEEGWIAVAPCPDVAAPYVMRLDPGRSAVTNYDVKIPLKGICKQRRLKLEGKFRFRWDYFDNEAKVRAYIDTLDSQGAYTAVSETFEIPPPKQ
jgi:hypothetical protein